jgi:hypothetical protein
MHDSIRYDEPVVVAVIRIPELRFHGYDSPYFIVLAAVSIEPATRWWNMKISWKLRSMMPIARYSLMFCRAGNAKSCNNPPVPRRIASFLREVTWNSPSTSCDSPRPQYDRKIQLPIYLSFRLWIQSIRAASPTVPTIIP